VIDAIRAWVRDIAVLLVVMAFLEILVPRSGMKRFIRVVTGLVVLLTILNPLLTLVKGGVRWDRADWELRLDGPSLREAFARGEKLRRESERLTFETWRRAVEERAADLVRARLDGEPLQVETVRVSLNADPEDPGYGQVEKIVVWLRVAQGTKTAVKEGGTTGITQIRVEVETGGKGVTPGAEAAFDRHLKGVMDEVRETLFHQFNLREDEVEVHLRGG